MALLDDIAASLVAAGIGSLDGTMDWMIFQYYMQDQPDNAICLYETGGKPPDTRFALDHPGFQVRVRSAANTPQIARAKMQAIFDRLHANDEPVTLGAGYVYCYAQQTGVIPIGQDEKRRPAFVQNYLVSRQRPAPVMAAKPSKKLG